MKSLKKKTQLLLWLLFIPLLSFGQTAVTGIVADANGELIIGANVMEKGARNSTVTDVNGKFTLNVAEGAVLQVSFLGYITREIAA
ncbi:MAG: carboxypeptidase-like regulatory domain-containing protein, partial [Lactobacillales bacterium]|nr:carboxypeptidase-like regulatory domain-containing protein [Lactobacillales bacterium]